MSDDDHEHVRDDDGGRRFAGPTLSFSLGVFVALLVLDVAGMVASAVYLPIGWYAVPFAVGFLAGVVSRHRPILEAGAAGMLTAGVAALIQDPILTMLGLGGYVVVAAGAGGLVTGALGAYFGSDLRDGLTREL